MLPGVLTRNSHLQFRCEWVNLRVETTHSPFTSAARVGQILKVPISHGEGNYYADQDTLDLLEENNQIAFRYCSIDGAITDEFNPNGAARNIAGITNIRGNVLGMMPHPERCCEEILGGSDGKMIFESAIRSLIGINDNSIAGIG